MHYLRQVCSAAMSCMIMSSLKTFAGTNGIAAEMLASLRACSYRTHSYKSLKLTGQLQPLTCTVSQRVVVLSDTIQ